jgi:hypothetical protein
LASAKGSILATVAAVAALGFAASAQAALIGDFELNGSLSNSAGTSLTLANNGGTLSSNGITFGLNQGPIISGFSALSAYTIDMTFTLDSLNGPRGNGYVKLIDFDSLASDSGYYSLGGELNAYPLSDSPTAVFTAGDPVRLTLSRDNTGLITAYIDDVEIYSQLDSSNASATAIDGLHPLTFFTDDFTTSQGEASSGSVDYIRIFDTAVTPGDAGPIPTGGVPEPATWAMMILGFGLAGTVLRQRKLVGAI